MPYLISDETRANIERALATHRPALPASVPPLGHGGVERAVVVYTGNLFAGYHYAELKWRDEPNFTWASFSPPVYCWALEMNGGDLVVNQHYPGFLVNVEEWSGLDLAVFAVGAGGGGDGSIFARVASANCTTGTFTITEVEPTNSAPWWQDRPGGVTNATARHFASGLGPFAAGGPLVQVGTRVRAWPGTGGDWRFDCPAGFTGQEEYVANWQCAGQPPVPVVTTRFRNLWNGLQTRQSCINNPPPISVCTPCPP